MSSDFDREILKQAIQRHLALTPGLPLHIDAAVVMALLRESEGASRKCEECGESTPTTCRACVNEMVDEVIADCRKGEYDP